MQTFPPPAEQKMMRLKRGLQSNYSNKLEKRSDVARSSQRTLLESAALCNF
jgi:hypothetical protein